MDSERPEIHELLQKAGAGDGGAVDALFARHRDQLHRAVALRLDGRVAARCDASDVVQQTLMEASRRLPQYLQRRDIPFALWLRGLACEKVIQLHRRHLGTDKRAAGREQLALPADSSAQFVRGMLARDPSPSQTLMAVELAERLRLALAQLDDDERDLILWRHFEQLSNREAAALLGVTAAAASKRYVRALERLRGVLINSGE
ncbi:MAG: sigma-70 family RNA polymerase sigma factor [Planctomycetia bacterium]|nr:sigma-70 family RNA polymerase sigma factor [Planctomycetia bacterium]